MSHFQSSGIKLAIYAAGNDHLVNAKDLLRLESLFPPALIQAQKLYDGFSHVTWMVGTTAAFQQWGGDVLNMLEEHVLYL